MAVATLCRQQLCNNRADALPRYARKPTVTTNLRKRRNPSNIEACITLVTCFENATRGELARRRTSAEKTGSGRITSQSSRSEVSVPARTCRDFKATGGNGGRLSGITNVRTVLVDCVVCAVTVPILPAPKRESLLKGIHRQRGGTITHYERAVDQSALRFQVSGHRSQVPGNRCRISNFRCEVLQKSSRGNLALGDYTRYLRPVTCELRPVTCLVR